MSTEPEKQAPDDDTTDSESVWVKERDRLKALWVVSVAFFWFSVFFQGTLYLMEKQVNFVLLSVIAGMLFLGVILKIRLQLHLRKKP